MKTFKKSRARLVLIAVGCFAVACNLVLGIHDLNPQPGALEFDAAPLDFGQVGCSTGPQTVTLTNTSTSVSSDWTATLGKGASSPFTITPASGTILPSQSATLTVTLQPGDAGTDSSGDTLSITTALGNTQIQLLRSALGAVLVVTPTTLALGGQPYNGTSPPFGVNIQNTGLGVASLDFAAPVPFLVDPSTLTLDAGSSGTVYVTFAPQQEAGVSGTLTITVSAQTVICGAPPSSVALSGNGTTGVVEIAQGTRHVCARTSDGRVFCWGNDQSRQLGTGDAAEPPNNNWGTPTFVQGLPAPATSLGMGYRTTCVGLLPRGVACWGYNSNSQAGVLEDINYSSFIVPSPVRLSTDPHMGPVEVEVKKLSGGTFTMCGSDSQGILYCWGDNSPFATDLAGGDTLANAVTLIAYDGLFARDPAIPLDDASPFNTQVAYPLNISSNVAQSTDFGMSAGNVCVVIQGQGFCWPNVIYDDAGFPADGSTYGPQLVFDAGTPTRISLGGAHSCVLLSDHTVACAGDNTFGQLGNGSFAPVPPNTPVKVQNLGDVRTLQAEIYGACVIKNDGSVWCWGNNSQGQLGDGTTNNSNVPVPVKGLTEPATQITGCGNGLCSFMCALTVAGHVWCWGDNGFLQLGQGSSGPPFSSTPLQVNPAAFQ